MKYLKSYIRAWIMFLAIYGGVFLLENALFEEGVLKNIFLVMISVSAVGGPICDYIKSKT